MMLPTTNPENEEDAASSLCRISSLRLLGEETASPLRVGTAGTNDGTSDGTSSAAATNKDDTSSATGRTSRRHVETPQMLTLGRYGYHHDSDEIHPRPPKQQHQQQRGSSSADYTDQWQSHLSDASAAPPENDTRVYSLPKPSWLSRWLSTSKPFPPESSTHSSALNATNGDDHAVNTNTAIPGSNRSNRSSPVVGGTKLQNQEDKVQPHSTKRRDYRRTKLVDDSTLQGSQRTSRPRRRIATIPTHHNHPFQECCGTTTTTLESSSPSQDSVYTALDDAPHSPHRNHDAAADGSFFFRESDDAAVASLSTRFDDAPWGSSSSGGGGGHGRHPSSPSISAVRRNHRQAPLYQYNDARPVMARPVLQQFRTKYAQLNQELVYPTSHTTNTNTTTNSSRYYRTNWRGAPSRHEVVLQLSLDPDPWDDMEALQSLHLQTIIDSSSSLLVSSSSLDLSVEAPTLATDTLHHHYHHSNDHCTLPLPPHDQDHFYLPHGPIREEQGYAPHITTPSYFVSSDLHRLPRDQVRLLMDPDLEAGILSVEQWRRREEEDDDTNRHHNDMNRHVDHPFVTTDPSPAQPSATGAMAPPPPPLRYVLTVSDDLYKSVVAEMSPTTTKYFCCPRACCNDEERADIRVAVSLLTVILVILFINTMAFHED